MGEIAADDVGTPARDIVDHRLEVCARELPREHGDDVLVACAGVQGRPSLDDTYVVGRIVELLGWERTDTAEAAARLVATWSGAEEALRASKSGRNLLANGPELEPGIPFCARESVLDVVPRLVALRDGAAEISGGR